MKKLYFLLIFFAFLTANAQQWQWAKNVTIASAARNVMEPDVNGNFYLAATSGTGACIVKFDGNGAELWRQCFPGPIQINGISSTGTDVFVAGTFQNTLSLLTSTIISGGMTDVFLMRLTSSGTFSWVKTYGGPLSDNAGDLTNDGKGYVYMTGTFNGSVMFDSYQGIDTCGSAMFVTKHDLAGNIQLFKQSTCIWSPSSFAHGNQIAVDNHSNIYVLGTYSYFNLDTIELSGGGGPYDPWFVTRIDSAGDVNWLKQAPTQVVQELQELALDANSDLLITGYHHWTLGGSTMTFKMNSQTGQVIWNHGIGGYCPGDQGVSGGIAVEGTNSYIFGSLSLGTNCTPGRRKILIARYDGTGQQILLDTIPLPSSAGNFDIINTEPNAYVVSGVMNPGQIVFGSYTVNAYNDPQLFIAKFYTPGSTTFIVKNTIENKLNVFPNPSSGIFEVKVNITTELKLFDLLGNCVQDRTCNASEPVLLDLRSFPKGIYMLQATTGESKSWKKLVKD